jgi:hypothetical protein
MLRGARGLRVLWASRADGLADLFAGRPELIRNIMAKFGAGLRSKKESHRGPDQRSGSEKCYGTEQRLRLRASRFEWNQLCKLLK